MKIVAIRPEPGLSATIRTGEQMGLGITGYPLSRVARVAWQILDDDAFDGLLIGSANAIRHAGENLEKLSALPVLAVGGTTANVAATAGFSVERTGSGGLQRLIDTLPEEPRHLLRLAGEDHVPLTIPPHIHVTTRVVYRVEHLPLPSGLVSDVSDNLLVLLHSASAAEHFSAECDRLGIDRESISLAAIGPRVVEAAGTGWKLAEAAQEPNDASLLALARYMCH